MIVTPLMPTGDFLFGFSVDFCVLRLFFSARLSNQNTNLFNIMSDFLALCLYQ